MAEETQEAIPTETEVGEVENENESALIQKAEDAAKAIEEQNERLEKNLERQEKLRAEKVLGGKTDAATQEMSKEEKEVEEAKKLIAGSGFEELAFPSENNKK